MEHFKVYASFGDFFPHLKSNIKPRKRHNVCILYKRVQDEQEIYISTADEKIKNVIAEKFELNACESPYDLYSGKEDEWMVRGNASLMQEK